MKQFLPIFLLIVSLHICNAQIITDFGSADTTIDPSTNFTTVTPSLNSINVIGNDGGQIFALTFAPVIIAPLTTINLQGTLTGANPNSLFTAELYNTDFSQERIYNGFLSSFPSGTETTVGLSLISQTASFNDIGAFVFTGGGTGSPLNFTFDTLTASPVAVPEPATYTLFSLGLIVVMLTYRFRLTSQYDQRTTH